MNTKRLVLLIIPTFVAVGLTAPDSASAQVTSKGSATITPQDSAKAKAKAAEKIDLNSATEEELKTLPGIGEVHAKKIIDNRPYKTVDDLTTAGLTSAMIAKIKPDVVVKEMPAQIDVNSATASQLEELPGVGPALAKTIMADRPYKSFDDLAKVKGLGPAKLAELKGRVKFGTAPAAEKASAKEPAARPVIDAKAKMKAKSGDAKAKSSAKPPLAEGEKIDINTASVDELQRLKGIGPVHARAIVDARPFAKIDDIMKVDGIKEGVFGNIKDHIKVK